MHLLLGSGRLVGTQRQRHTHRNTTWIESSSLFIFTLLTTFETCGSQSPATVLPCTDSPVSTDTHSAPAAAHGSCSGDPVVQAQLRVNSSLQSQPSSDDSLRTCSDWASYLVTVYGVLGCPGGDGDGIWLAAAVSLTVSIFPSLPEWGQTYRSVRIKGLWLQKVTLQRICSLCIRLNLLFAIITTIIQFSYSDYHYWDYQNGKQEEHLSVLQVLVFGYMHKSYDPVRCE